MRVNLWTIGGLALLAATSSVAAQMPPREPTDVLIRRLAGLPASSARGQIEIIDVGHGIHDTMPSIVGHRTRKGWEVPLACAASPYCVNNPVPITPTIDHDARSYTLSPSATAEVDRLLEQPATTGEPDGQLPSPDVSGGRLHVAIDYRGLKRVYERVTTWGEVLGRLEALMRGEPTER